MLQDLFASGAITSATDFQVYKEVAGLSGLDFAYTDKSAVYHTKVYISCTFQHPSGIVIIFIHFVKHYSSLQLMFWSNK